MTFKDKARIVITSSVAHKFGSIRWHDLNSTQSYNSGSAYAQSKLANVLYANALARKLQVNYIHNSRGFLQRQLCERQLFRQKFNC